jgi:uncharacterized protein
MPNVGRSGPNKTHTQSVCFYKDAGWTESSSRSWVKDHDYITNGLDETDLLFRWSQYDPDDQKFKYRNQVIEQDSIFLVIGFPDGSRNMTAHRELRYIAFDDFELRDENDGPHLRGYASLFDVEAIIWGMWREKVALGSYKRTIKDHDIRALWNHNADLVLGRNKAGTLILSEDKKGLGVDIHPPDTQAGRDAVTSIKRGDVTQMSIGFETIKQEWQYSENKNELPLRTITESKLFEVSPVTFPAFEQTSIQARSILYLPNLPDGNLDPLEEARILYGCAKYGMRLTPEQRELLQAAIDLYSPLVLDPESENGHHSSPAADSEHTQDLVLDGHYSAQERSRRLEELSKLYNLPL